MPSAAKTCSNRRDQAVGQARRRRLLGAKEAATFGWDVSCQALYPDEVLDAWAVSATLGDVHWSHGSVLNAVSVVITRLVVHRLDMERR